MKLDLNLITLKSKPLESLDSYETLPVYGFNTTAIDHKFNELKQFNKARKELQVALSIEEVKHIRDKAEAVRVYASQAKYFLEMQNMCAEIKLRAERKIGEMLKKLEVTQNGSANQLRGRIAQPRENSPSLKELGISKSQSTRWRMIAGIPIEKFQKRIDEIKKASKELTTGDMVKYYKYLTREKNRESERINAIRTAQLSNADERIRIVHGDFRNILTAPLIQEDSVDLILTDPPYGVEFLSLWKDLAIFAAKTLKPGKLLVTYSGNYHLARVMSLLAGDLQYVWIAAVMNGSTPDTIFPHHIMTHWKPALLFSKGNYRPAQKREWFKDRLDGAGREKTHHKWEQGVDEARRLVEAFTHPGDLVVDPFLGSGTNALAAKKLSRRFIGCDLDEKAVGIAIERIYGSYPEETVNASEAEHSSCSKQQLLSELERWR